jgi:iron complex transport system substrate-binding protein
VIERLSRRRLVSTGAVAAALLPFAGRAQSATPDASPVAEGGWSFTDDRGVTVTLPQAPTKIVADLSAAAPLWDFGIRPLAVCGWTVTTDAAWGNVDRSTPIINAGDDMPDPDLEQLVALDPDLFVSITWAPDEPENVWSFMDAEGYNRTNDRVPVVCISATGLANANMERFAELSGLLGADLEAPEIVAAKTAYEAAVTAFSGLVAEKAEITSLFAGLLESGDVWFAAYPPDWADLAWYQSLGMNIVQPNAEPGQYWEELSLEQAGLYPCDVFFSSSRDESPTIEELKAMPTFAAHPAIAAGQIGAWNQDFIMSYQGLTAALTNMIDVLTVAEKVS